MSTDEFKVNLGDIVVVNTGSPEMTINEFELDPNTDEYNGYVICIRYSGDEKIIERLHHHAIRTI